MYESSYRQRPLVLISYLRSRVSYTKLSDDGPTQIQPGTYMLYWHFQNDGHGGGDDNGLSTITMTERFAREADIESPFSEFPG